MISFVNKRQNSSNALPNFRSTPLTSMKRKRIAITAPDRSCLSNERYRGGVVMQTQTGGELSTPSQKRMRRELVAQYGNTRLIPTQIEDPAGLAEARLKPVLNPMGSLADRQEKNAGDVRNSMMLSMGEQYRKMNEEGYGDSAEAQQLEERMRAVGAKNPSVFDEPGVQEFYAKGAIEGRMRMEYEKVKSQFDPREESRDEAYKLSYGEDFPNYDRFTDEYENFMNPPKKNPKNPIPLPDTPIAGKTRSKEKGKGKEREKQEFHLTPEQITEALKRMDDSEAMRRMDTKGSSSSRDSEVVAVLNKNIDTSKMTENDKSDLIRQLDEAEASAKVENTYNKKGKGSSSSSSSSSGIANTILPGTAPTTAPATPPRKTTPPATPPSKSSPSLIDTIVPDSNSKRSILTPIRSPRQLSGFSPQTKSTQQSPKPMGATVKTSGPSKKSTT